MTSKATLLLALLGLTTLYSCSKMVKAGFWANYPGAGLPLKLDSQERPDGGHVELYWKVRKPNTFTATALIAFAAKNGWTFTDSIALSPQTVRKLTNSKEAFPFTFSDFADTSMNTTTFHNWIGTDMKLYRFATNQIAVEPVTGRKTDNNGYVAVNGDGTELAVYYRWGVWEHDIK